MEYKGFTGSVEFSKEDGVYFGKALNERALISYEGATLEELEADFHGAVDDLLAFEAQREQTKRLVSACDSLFDLKSLAPNKGNIYASLPLCVIDAVFSIGVKYASTIKAVKRYCQYYGVTRHKSDLCKGEPEHTISQMIAGLEAMDVESCADTVFCNRQRTSARSGILKAEAVLAFARILAKHNIETIEDLRTKGICAEVEAEIRQIPGQKSGISLRYFCMLAGDESYAKPDRHILRFIQRYTGVTPTVDEAQSLFEDTVAELNNKYPNLTVRLLDNVIWEYMANNPVSKEPIPYHKLVRDRIPQIIEASGKTCQIVTMGEAEYLRMLDAKLDEELAEYHRDHSLEELADLLEVIRAVTMARGYSLEELEQVRAQKENECGAFAKKLLLIDVVEK